MKLRALLLTVALGVSLLVSGCWIPEDFKTSVTVHKDGSYTFAYDGILTFALALAFAKERPLSEKDEKIFEEEAEELEKEQGFKKVEYLGKGRYKVLVEKSGDAAEPYYFLSPKMKIFAINPGESGSIEITAEQLGKKDIDELKSLGAKVKGTLTVYVETGVKVINHNAQSEPKLFGLFGGYEWQINSVDAEPLIVVQPQL